MRDIGYADLVEHWQNGSDLHFAYRDEHIHSLRQLPIVVGSVAEFDDVFPEARQQSMAYASQLAGNRAWLPQVLDDYFHAGGQLAWIVLVDEADGADAFMPRPRRTVTDQPHELIGSELIHLLPHVGYLALPDAERLAIPQQLRGGAQEIAGIPADPVFCTYGTEAHDRTRRGGHRAVCRSTHQIPSRNPLKMLLC